MVSKTTKQMDKDWANGSFNLLVCMELDRMRCCGIISDVLMPKYLNQLGGTYLIGKSQKLQAERTQPPTMISATVGQSEEQRGWLS